MQIIVQDTAHNSIDSAYEYLSNYSVKNAIETTEGIYASIYDLENSPYLGRYIPEMTDKQFREIIYKRHRNQAYRIVYHVSENTNSIHILYVANCKQDFISILKIHNYFKNYFEF